MMNPRRAAQNIRRQFGPSRRPLRACMRSPSSRDAVEGPACVKAWRCHFRDVSASASFFFPRTFFFHKLRAGPGAGLLVYRGPLPVQAGMRLARGGASKSLRGRR